MTTPEPGHASGLIVGRFDPPHLGHSYMIDWAAQRCDRLVVYVNSSPERDVVAGALRTAWLSELHPHVTVIQVEHGLRTDFADEELWGRWISLFRSRWPFVDGPDVVFSSDEYVAELARRLAAVAVVVDPDRANVPINGTQIRASPADHLDHVAPPVRTWIRANWL